VKKAAESAMREVIGRTPIQPALTEKRAEIENDTRELLQRMLNDYQSGVEITQVQLLKTAAPTPVVDAFDDVQRAKADKERLRNEAEAYRNDIIPRARGEAARLVQEAEAYKEQVVDLAQGDAQRFSAVQGAYAQNKETTMRRLYLETMEAVLKGANKIILDGQSGGAVPYLPLNEMLHRAPGAAPSGAAPSAPSTPSAGAR
jgi:membrane protease subunit HflK